VCQLVICVARGKTKDKFIPFDLYVKLPIVGTA
jgi:hypothetical protein